MAHTTVPFHGKVCMVYVEGTNMEYEKGWTLNVTLDMADASRAGQQWKEGLPGQAGWSGSFEMYHAAANAQQLVIFQRIISATPGTVLAASRFVLDVAANYYSGSFYITGCSINATMGGIASASVNFQGTGVLALTP